MKKVLIIEDDESISQALTMALELEGFSIRPVLKAKESLAHIKAFKPDIILLDLLLSGIDGRHVAKDIKAHKKMATIPIILLSAHPAARAAAEEIKADDFIAKPFDVNDLIVKINKLI
jgi:DNA-binding response OmpR family regulator